MEVNRGAVQLIVRVLNSCLYPGLRLPQGSDRCRLCARGTNRAASTAEGVKAWAKAINGVVLGRLACPRWFMSWGVPAWCWREARAWRSTAELCLIVRVLDSRLYPGLRLPQSSNRCRLGARGTCRAAALAADVKTWAKAINGVVLGWLVCPRSNLPQSTKVKKNVDKHCSTWMRVCSGRP